MKAVCLVVALMLGVGSAFAENQSADERAVWQLEQAYWKYVQAGDLESYRNLWHPNFLGWPNSSARPKRKDHITDWITESTKKGLRLKSYQLEPAASKATGNVVVTHYWITDRWVDKEGHGDSETLRITHTWIRISGGWQIIGGMSGTVTQGKK
jgi:ketosteroid isomerase-like protein